MSTLILIRHGQASFGAADYDVLSPLGVRQSTTLGDHLASRGVALDALYSGPAKRQRDTALHLRSRAEELGASYPDAGVVDELDEYPAFELFKQIMPQLRQREPDLDAIVASGGLAAHRLFTQVFSEWARGALDSGEHETFAAFEDRVNRGLDRIMEQEGRGKTVAVTTSAGPIAMAMRRALGIPPERWAQMLFVIANSSMTELRYTEDELSLVAFNRIPHLELREHITYR